MSVWSYRSTDWPGIYDLVFGERCAAECYWFHNPSHPSVTMTRLVDRLNLPAAECAQSPAPSWSMVDVPADREANPGAWRTYSLDGVEVMAVIWKREPSRLEEWHQRILDALNSGRGLQAVDIPSLHESSAALLSPTSITQCVSHEIFQTATKEHTNEATR